MWNFLIVIALALLLHGKPADAQVRFISLGDSVTSTGAQTRTGFNTPQTAFVSGETSAGAGSATVDIEVSNDGVSYVTACTITLTLSTTAAADGCAINAHWRFTRMNVTAISGTGAEVTGTLAGQR